MVQILAYNKNKLFKILDYLYRSMLDFDILEKSLGIVSPPHFGYNFSRKMFFMWWWWWWWCWWWIVFVVWLTNERHLALFPARTIVRDPHHRKSPTGCKDLNLCRTWVQALLNEVVQYIMFCEWSSAVHCAVYYVL